MAIDEVLLQTTRTALLRFYRWSEPAASFGYFGKFEEALRFAGERPLVRRWTGGGTVPHGHDLTYSLLIGSSQPAYQLSSPALYRRIHENIAAALFSCGVATHFVSNSRPRTSDACFANPVAADLLEGNRKIAGAAHRKTRHGLLHQGSIQRDELDHRFRQNLAITLSDEVVSDEISLAVIEGGQRLAAEKYATDAWLCRK
jgi:lipoyl(octanoyl) transferase